MKFTSQPTVRLKSTPGAGKMPDRGHSVENRTFFEIEIKGFNK